MGANTRIRVRVLKSYEDVIELSAVTRDHAEEIARAMPDVIHVIGSWYKREDEGEK